MTHGIRPGDIEAARRDVSESPLYDPQIHQAPNGWWTVTVGAYPTRSEAESVAVSVRSLKSHVEYLVSKVLGSQNEGHYGQMLREIRDEKGLTRTEAGELADVSANSIAYIEQGDLKMLTPEFVKYVHALLEMWMRNGNGGS